MKNVMTWIIGITLTLGMIALFVLGQVSGARDIGEKADTEQTKVSIMIADNDVVTGKTVLNYMKQGVSVTVGSNSSPTVSDVNEKALYKMVKAYDSDGEVTSVTFTHVDL